MTSAVLRRPTRSTATAIYLDRDGRSVRVDVRLGSFTHRMVIDTGMTGLSIPLLVAERLLLRRDAIESDDAIVTLANGAREWRRGIEIRSVSVAGHTLRDVHATVASHASEPLLGFPILNQLGRFTIDTIERLLIMG